MRRRKTAKQSPHVYSKPDHPFYLPVDFSYRINRSGYAGRDHWLDARQQSDIRDIARFHDGGGGTTNDLTSVPFDGIIDEVALYNTALTQGQIDQHILNCAPPLAVSLSGFTAVPSVMMPIVLAVFALLTIATAVAVRHHRS